MSGIYAKTSFCAPLSDLAPVADITNVRWYRKKPSSLFLLMRSIRVIKLAGAPPVP